MHGFFMLRAFANFRFAEVVGQLRVCERIRSVVILFHGEGENMVFFFFHGSENRLPN